MDSDESTSTEILALFSTFKEKRIQLYNSFVKDIEDFQNWVIPVERMLAYFLTIMNLKKFGDDLKEKVEKEIIRLNEGDFISQ